MTDDILQTYNGELRCNCAHASLNCSNKGWCCDVFSYDFVSCKEAYGTERCKKSAYQERKMSLTVPEMLFQEGDVKNTLTNLKRIEFTIQEICEKLGYEIMKKGDLLRAWETYCADGRCPYKPICEFIEADCPVLKFIKREE